MQYVLGCAFAQTTFLHVHSTSTFVLIHHSTIWSRYNFESAEYHATSLNWLHQNLSQLNKKSNIKSQENSSVLCPDVLYKRTICKYSATHLAIGVCKITRIWWADFVTFIPDCTQNIPLRRTSCQTISAMRRHLEAIHLPDRGFSLLGR